MHLPIYLKVEIPVADDEFSEILQALLAEIGFESFETEDKLLIGYIQKAFFTEEQFRAVLQQYSTQDAVLSEIEPVNWNARWESEFQPIIIPGELIIRAQFHSSPQGFPLEIIIDPKMSFGTGHHATTWQVLKLMLGMDLKNTKVLDFGTGTGILAILAVKRGAREVWAVDIDPQCIHNAKENIELNDTQGIKLLQGDIHAVEEQSFDLVIGNITRNTILEYLPDISKHMVPGGFFIASGFYLNDLALISTEAESQDLTLLKYSEKEQWCAALFQKNGKTHA